MAKRTTETRQTDPQDIQELTDRYQELNRRKIEAEANLKTAKKQLDDLCKKATKDYGTADLGELQSKLEKLRKENKKKRADYQTSLDEIEKKLKEVNTEHGTFAEVEVDEKQVE